MLKDLTYRFGWNEKNPLLLILILTAFAHLRPAISAVYPTIPDYQKTDNLTGTINSTGSDTMANLLFFWSEAFKQNHPDAETHVYAEGSSTGPAALITNTANIAPMSRRMKPEEHNAFLQKYGYRPQG